jgi:hypothetical protein
MPHIPCAHHPIAGQAEHTLLTSHCVTIVQKLAPWVLPPTGPGIAVQLPEFGPSACLLRKVGGEGFGRVLTWLA